MNTHPGVLGVKLGMTQLVAADGTVTPCTVVEAKPVVVAKRTAATDGYDALVLGVIETVEKRLNKPELGLFKKSDVAPRRVLRELRCSAEHAAKFEVGQVLPLDQLFAEGQLVDVQGVSRGRGFTGVMRRHNFKGAVSTHGSHEYKRHGGSIGSNMTPGRTFKGKRMPGQMGNVTTSVLNQRIAKVLVEDGLLLVHGGIPGSRNAVVVVRGAVRKNGGKPAA